MINSQERKKIVVELEQKAASILERIGEKQDPVFIEFCGTPKSGKTTVVNSLNLFLRRNGFKVEIIQERASVCPIPRKNHIHFNIWTSLATLNSMLALRDSPNDVVLIDRGIFDAMVWFFWMRNTGRLTETELRCIEQFICMECWTSLVDIVFMLKVDYETAKDREFGNLLTFKEGSIMNNRVISQYNDALLQLKEYFHNKIKFIETDYIDTTNINPMEGVKRVTQRALEILDKSLDEKILAIPADTLKELSIVSGFVDCGDGNKFNQIVKELGKFIPRSDVEKSETHIQLIPCAILEYKGNILLLKRSEIDPNNRLHEKYVIWAGGHIREQDTSDDTLTNGLKRELAEELFIRSQYAISGPIGFVYFAGHPKARKHLGVVYKVALANPDVALGLDQTEFKERRGKSLSGTFQSLDKLKEYYTGMEQWSKMILEKYYKITLETSPQQLFNF